MSDPSSSDVLDGMSSKALSCVAALRIGGGLYILAEAAGQGDLYYQADAGVRAGLRSCEGRRLNADVVRIAKKACRRLIAEFSGAERTLQFSLGGFELLEAVLDLIEAEVGETSESYITVFQKAFEVASLWPETVDIDGHVSLQEFERSCQRESITQLRAGGIPGLRGVLGPRELSYRDLARGIS
ncbi:hypothetical protein [Streptomyces hyaluromycini]|uniref:hypothetical protein n=1 Tax=Streptomyces hyaluromycini TaxID=1377993 RepID=UPI0011AE3DA0|nr:hypothetical protein [Streptomyces hyaluromycini]